MFIIEYVSTPIGPKTTGVCSELALGSTVEEAKDQADRHLGELKAKYGVDAYQIWDKDKNRVAIGPSGKA
jgi:hypothetical protein